MNLFTNLNNPILIMYKYILHTFTQKKNYTHTQTEYHVMNTFLFLSSVLLNHV